MSNDTLLEMRGITKDFPGVRALEKIDFDLKKGEVHALVGENGAGKSTLMLILGGVHLTYEGQILLDNEMVKLSSPRDAIRRGIGIIYQEIDLAREFSVGESLFLGDERIVRRMGILRFLDRRKIFEESQRLLDELEFDISSRAKVDDLSVGDQQLVQIARAIRLSARVLIMDEPTARLAYHETENLFRIISTLKQKGIGIIYISHHMEEILRVADRVTVLRDGRVVGQVEAKTTSLPEIVRLVVGKELASGINFPKISHGNQVLSVQGLTKEGIFEDINLSVHAGEVLGIGGLVGSGRTEMARCIFGADRATKGKISVEGQDIELNSPRDAIKAGIVLVPEERKSQGLILSHSLLANLSLPLLRTITKFKFIKLHEQRRVVKEMIAALDIKTPTILQEVGLLSGGNQQKVVIGKWLALKPKVIVMDQPTRGIDVGAKQEIYRLIADLAKNGSTCIVISDELNELTGLADRILLMRNGRIVKEFFRGEVNRGELLEAVVSNGTAAEICDEKSVQRFTLKKSASSDDQ